MIYEFITPSDPITFVAPNDQVAFCCAVLVGRGQAFCTREDGQKVPSGLIFLSSEKAISDTIAEVLGTNDKIIADYIQENADACAAALDSFAYGKKRDRQQYDAAIAAITDPEKLKEFKVKHDDINRSSMNMWVAAAWEMADVVRQKSQEQAQNKN